MSAIAPSSSRMSDKQMHPAFCSCHVGSSLTGQEAAERLRHVMRLDPKDTDLSVMAEGPAHLPPPPKATAPSRGRCSRRAPRPTGPIDPVATGSAAITATAAVVVFRT